MMKKNKYVQTIYGNRIIVNMNTDRQTAKIDTAGSGNRRKDQKIERESASERKKM